MTMEYGKIKGIEKKVSRIVQGTIMLQVSKMAGSGSRNWAGFSQISAMKSGYV